MTSQQMLAPKQWPNGSPSGKDRTSEGRSHVIHHVLNTGREGRHFVEHDYHDHADDPQSDYLEIEQRSAASKKGMDDDDSCDEYRAQRARGGVTVPFPLKLHRMLEVINDDGKGHIVSWQPHGRAFLVKNPQEFVSEVMPKYFKQTKLTSFQRQLNLYGFRRLTKGSDAGAYYHELFLRGRAYLCHKMMRIKIKGTGFKAASSPETEPNFYQMPFVYRRDASSKMQWEEPDPQDVHSCRDSYARRRMPVPMEPLSSNVAAPLRHLPDPQYSHPGAVDALAVPITPEHRPRQFIPFLEGSMDRGAGFPPLDLTTPNVSAPLGSSHGEFSWQASNATLAPRFPEDAKNENVISFEGQQFYYLDSSDLICL